MNITARKNKLSHLAATMVREYGVVTRGANGFLTDKVRWALLADAMYTIMLAQYGEEKQSGQDNLVDAYKEAAKSLELE